MQRNDRALVAGITIGVGSALLVWAIVAGAFAVPGDGGFIYHYQTLIGVLFALLAAGLTVLMMHREQRQQREHFERQVDVLTRADRLLISRETAIILPPLQQALLGLRRVPADVEGINDGRGKYQVTFRAIHETLDAIREDRFAGVVSFLDDEFTRRRARLYSRLMETYSAMPVAFGARPWDPVTILEGISADRAINILQRNDWLHFNHAEHRLQWLIVYLQAMRTDYGLPPLD